MPSNYIQGYKCLTLVEVLNKIMKLTSAQKDEKNNWPDDGFLFNLVVSVASLLEVKVDSS